VIWVILVQDNKSSKGWVVWVKGIECDIDYMS
jgi:hypothetical protein